MKGLGLLCSAATRDMEGALSAPSRCLPPEEALGETLRPSPARSEQGSECGFCAFAARSQGTPTPIAGGPKGNETLPPPRKSEHSAEPGFLRSESWPAS